MVWKKLDLGEYRAESTVARAQRSDGTVSETFIKAWA